MTILHVVQYSLPELLSGYTIRTQAVARAQKGVGLEPLVVTSPRHPTDEERDVDGIPHFRCAREQARGNVWRRDARRVWHLSNRICDIAAARGDVRLIHAHSPVLCGAAALRAGRRLGLPVVYEVRGLWEEAMIQGAPVRRFSPRYLLARMMERRACSGADAVVTISQGLRDEFLRRGVPRDKIHVVPNGVDIQAFSPRSPHPGWRASHNLTSDPLILYLGAIRAYEGIDLLIDAFLAVRQSTRVQLLIVGHGSLQDRVASRIRSCEEEISLLPAVPHDAVPDFYAAADVVVYPRLSSRVTELVTPLKPLEAMAMGKAIVASDVAGLREILTDRRTARLFPAGSVFALADTLTELLHDAAQRQRIGEAARRVACDQFDWRTLVHKYVGIYWSTLRA